MKKKEALALKHRTKIVEQACTAITTNLKAIAANPNNKPLALKKEKVFMASIISHQLTSAELFFCIPSALMAQLSPYLQSAHAPPPTVPSNAAEKADATSAAAEESKE